MAQPSLIPGQAGAINLGADAGNPSHDLLTLINAVQQIQQQKQTSAQQQVELMIKMNEEHGIPFDEQAFTKAAKDAGMPIDMLTKAMAPSATKGMGKALEGNGQGAQSAFQLPSNSASQNPGGGVQKTPDVPQAKEGTVASSPQSFVEQLMQAGTRNWQAAQLGKEQQFALSQRTNELKNTILDKSQKGEAYGKELGSLAAVTGQQINLSQFNYADASPEERQMMAGIAAGQETAAQKEMRLSSQAQQAFATGRFRDLGEARAFAEGKQVDMKPDLQRMVQETQFTNELLQAGLDPEQAKEVGRKMANGISLSDALPKDFVPFVTQQMGIEKQKMQLMKDDLQLRKDEMTQKGTQFSAEQQMKLADLKLQKYGIDMQARWHDEEVASKANELMLKLKSQGDEDFQKQFELMVNMKRAGMDVPKDFQQNMVNDLAGRTGMVPKDVSGIWNWLVGSKAYEYSPGDTSSSTISKAIGNPQTPGASDHFSPVFTPAPKAKAKSPVSGSDLKIRALSDIIQSDFKRKRQ